MNVSRLCYLPLRHSKPPFLFARLQKVRLNYRPVSTTSTYRREVAVEKHLQSESLVSRVLKKIPFLNVNKTRVMAASYLLYEKIADNVNYVDFFQELDLPDTFYSWFVVTELHIWMLSARGMAEGDDGRFLRNYLVEALWNDVAQRIKRLGGDANPVSAREQVAALAEQLQAALIAYDEGLQGDDTILAGALWRRFYQQKEVEPQYLETLVRFVRKQMRLLDHLPKETIFEKKNVVWIPLN